MPEHRGQATYLTFHRKTHNTCFGYQSRFTSTPGSATVLRTGRTLNCYALIFNIFLFAHSRH